MPCTCWYNPPEAEKKLIKFRCEQIVRQIKDLEKHGDPIGISLESVKELLDHLYTGKCDERADS